MPEDDFDDIFGTATTSPPAPAEPAPRRGRPRTRDIYPEVQAETEAEEAKTREFYASREGQRRIRAAASGRTEAFNEKDFYQPVSVTFLSKVLRMNLETVQKRLRTVTPVGHAGTAQNRPLYDFVVAVEHLVKPKMNLRTYLRSLNTADMPQNISKAFWEAEHIRNKTLLATGEAWPTEDVIQVMSQANKMVNDRIPLLVEAMREENLTDDQMKKLEAACDQFRNDVHEAYVEFPKQQATPSRLAQVAIGVDDE